MTKPGRPSGLRVFDYWLENPRLGGDKRLLATAEHFDSAEALREARRYAREHGYNENRIHVREVRK